MCRGARRKSSSRLSSLPDVQNLLRQHLLRLLQIQESCGVHIHELTYDLSVLQLTLNRPVVDGCDCDQTQSGVVDPSPVHNLQDTQAYQNARPGLKTQP